MRLANRTAIVTGGANGIGRAIAEVFAEQGASVFIADVDVAAGEETTRKLRERQLKASFVECEVSSANAVSGFIKTAASASGRIDVLCNNAAWIAPQWRNAVDASEEEWEKSFRVALMGSQLFVRETLPFMVRQKAGSIINISSVQGLVAGRTSVAYTTIKHALIGFTR